MKPAVLTATACVAVAACTTTPQASVAPAKPQKPHALMHLAQFGYQRGAQFQQCHGDACPRATPKTLGPVPQARNLRMAPTASPPSATPTEEFLDAEERIDLGADVFPFRTTGPLSGAQLRELFPAASTAPDASKRPADHPTSELAAPSEANAPP